MTTGNITYDPGTGGTGTDAGSTDLGWVVGAALIGGAAVLGLGGIAIYGAITGAKKALPRLLPYAQEVLPAYDAYKGAGRGERLVRGLEFANVAFGNPRVQRRGAVREVDVAAELAKAPTVPHVTEWFWAKDLHGRDVIRGYVFNKAGVADGEGVTIEPVRYLDGRPVMPGDELSGASVKTARSTYLIGVRGHDYGSGDLPPYQDRAAMTRYGGRR
jgi:hypothetical protein